MGRKIVFGIIIFWFAIQVFFPAAGYGGETIRPDLMVAQLLVLMIPVRSVRPDGTKLYSAMLYRVVSSPIDEGKRKCEVQFYPKNFEPWGK